jgi:hypothetical protein
MVFRANAYSNEGTAHRNPRVRMTLKEYTGTAAGTDENKCHAGMTGSQVSLRDKLRKPKTPRR